MGCARIFAHSLGNARNLAMLKDKSGETIGGGHEGALLEYNYRAVSGDLLNGWICFGLTNNIRDQAQTYSVGFNT